MGELFEQDRQLDRQSHELGDQFRRAPNQEREELRGKLREVVEKHFNIRQERRRLELRRLEEELGRLRESIEQREENRSSIIQRRLNELTGEDRGLSF